MLKVFLINISLPLVINPNINKLDKLSFRSLCVYIF